MVSSPPSFSEHTSVTWMVSSTAFSRYFKIERDCGYVRSVCQNTPAIVLMGLRPLFSSTTFTRSTTKTVRHYMYGCGLLFPIKKKRRSNCRMVFSNSS